MTSSDKPIESNWNGRFLNSCACDKILRVAKHGVAPGKRQKTDRHVDQKDPSPVVRVRYPAAEGRTDDRRDQRRQAEQRHRHALLFPREGVQQHPLAAGLQTAARQTLDDAEQDQLTETAGHSAQRGAEGETPLSTARK